MSAASLDRNADWWESFITHAVCPDPPPSETMQSHTRSQRQTYACVMHPSRLWHLLWCHHSMGRRRLSYSDSPKSHNTTSNTHTHATALHESPCPHPITPPCPSCRGTSLALCISSTSTISCSVAPRGLCLLLKADRLDTFYLWIYNFIIRSRMENTSVNGV